MRQIILVILNSLSLLSLVACQDNTSGASGLSGTETYAAYDGYVDRNEGMPPEAFAGRPYKLFRFAVDSNSISVDGNNLTILEALRWLDPAWEQISSDDYLGFLQLNISSGPNANYETYSKLVDELEADMERRKQTASRATYNKPIEDLTNDEIKRINRMITVNIVDET